MGALLLASAWAEEGGASSNADGGSIGSNAPATGGGAGSEIPSTDLYCNLNEVRVRVTSASGTVTNTFSGVGHRFSNKTGADPGRRGISSDGASFQVVFDEFVAGGESVPARGSISIAGLRLGNCDADGNPGTLTLDEDADGGRIVLTRIHSC